MYTEQIITHVMERNTYLTYVGTSAWSGIPASRSTFRNAEQFYDNELTLEQYRTS
jgi:hypothetical protein